LNDPWIDRVVVGDATLYLGDCARIAPLTGPFDAIVTDPPYGQALKTNVRRSAGDAKRYPDRIAGDDAPFDPAWLFDLAPVALVWGAHQFARRLPADGRWLVWDKRAGKVPSKAQADGEMAWANRNAPGVSGLRIFRLLWDGQCVDGAAREDVAAGRPRVHPTQKPLALMRWCLAQIDLPAGAHVVDPYMGSGSTGVACLDAGLRFTGMEIEPQYFEVAVRRISEVHGAPRLFVAAPRERVEREVAPPTWARAA
jgi:site-specific DNA-methyltransferase (adenine-specific)